MALLRDIFDVPKDIKQDRDFLDDLGLHLDFPRKRELPEVQGEGKQEYSEHYGEGEPCKQGETASKTKCIPEGEDKPSAKQNATDKRTAKLTPKELASKILELSKDPVNLLDSPEKQKKLATLVFASAAKVARFMLNAFAGQAVKDVVAAVKVVAGLKEVKRGWKALSGNGEWTKEDGVALKRALYDLPAFAIPTAVNWMLPTGPLVPMLYAHPKTKQWFAKELTEPSDDKVTAMLNKLESYFDEVEGKIADKVNYGREFGLDLTPAGIRFLTDVLRLSYPDLHRMKAGLFSE